MPLQHPTNLLPAVEEILSRAIENLLAVYVTGAYWFARGLLGRAERYDGCGFFVGEEIVDVAATDLD